MRLISLVAVTIVCLLSACGLPEDNATPKTTEAANLKPMNGREQALMLGAEGAARQGNTDAAEHDYMEAIAASTGRVDAHLALAKLYEKTNQPEKERQILARALEMQPGHPEANYILGKMELSEGDEATALEAFNAGLGTSPNNLDLLTGKGIANDMLGHHEVAQAAYKHAMDSSPKADLAPVRINLAMSYLLSNQPKEAEALLKPEVKKPGASPVARHNLALAYGLLGKTVEARELVHGEMDEETRTLALARLKEYIDDRTLGRDHPVPIKPAITKAPKK